MQNPESARCASAVDNSGENVANTLYFGDNLDILREYVPDESVDLIYLDPPFNSQAHYNLLFKTPQAEAVASQAEAFRDTWTWGEETKREYNLGHFKLTHYQNTP
jgi:adenine specific DNA methylase Mod